MSHQLCSYEHISFISCMCCCCSSPRTRADQFSRWDKAKRLKFTSRNYCGRLSHSSTFRLQHFAEELLIKHRAYWFFALWVVWPTTAVCSHRVCGGIFKFSYVVCKFWICPRLASIKRITTFVCIFNTGVVISGMFSGAFRALCLLTCCSSLFFFAVHWLKQPTP